MYIFITTVLIVIPVGSMVTKNKLNKIQIDILCVKVLLRRQLSNMIDILNLGGLFTFMFI